ncbi:MAG TPA: tetratricopeptide repeat protein [Candidatus Limnocylindria bacterium]
MEGQTPLRGRGEELAALAALTSRAAAGTVGVAVIEGEPGIGKSSLLTATLRHAGEQGFGWTIGRATELDIHRPFGAIAQAMTAWSVPEWSAEAAADEFMARLRDAPGDDARGFEFHLTDRTVELLERFSLRQPVALAIDDLHWADVSTLRTLQSAALRLTGYPVLLLASLRPFPRSRPLDGVVDGWLRGGASHLNLAPLDSQAMVEIARDILGTEPGPRLRAKLRAAGGNPLFVTELVAALQRDQPLATGGGQASNGADATLPPALRAVLLRRLGVLPADAIELLRLAAVLGEWFELRELEALSGRSPAELGTLLDVPLATRILEEDGGGLRFRHELIRDAIYHDQPATLRAALHRQAGEALAAAGVPASRVAHHLALGAQPGDVQAITWLRRAASEAGARDPAAAIGLLRQALALLPDGGGDARVNEELATSLAYSGNTAEAEDLIRQMLAAPGAAVSDGLTATLIQTIFAQGRWADLVATTTEFLATPDLEPRYRARLLAERSLGRIWTGDSGGAKADAEEAVRIGREIDDTSAVSIGLGHLSALADQRGEFAAGVQLATEGLQIGMASPEAQRRHPHVALGMALVAADRLTDALETLRAGQRLGEQLGTIWDLPLYHTMLALPMLYLGAWDDAVAECQAGLALADEVGARVGRVTALSIQALIGSARGELTVAEANIERAHAIVQREGPQWGELWLTLADARLRQAQGDIPGAFGVLRSAWAQARERDAIESALRIGPEIVRLALPLEEAAVARDVAETLEPMAERAGVPYATAAAGLARGLLVDDTALLVRAVESYRAAERIPELGRALVDAAASVARAGAASARPLFDEALDIFDRLAADTESQRALAAMRSVGLRRGSRSPRRRATAGWEALTDTERRVVELATAGLTNKQIGQRLFISPRTVQTHLAHVFGKLGLASRVELASRYGARDRR